MICHVMHFEHEQKSRWGVLLSDTLYPLEQFYSSTADFIEHGRDVAYQLQKDIQGSEEAAGLSVAAVRVLSPVTPTARVLCQGANYREHMIDSGMDPDAKVFNMFFTKSSASLCPGSSDIIRPAHVELLDYEVELGALPSPI